MHSLESQRLLPFLAALLVSTALLWLGAEVFAAARARPSRVGKMLRAASIAIGGVALWFPGHFLGPADAPGGALAGIPFVAALLGLGFWGLAGTTAVAATRKTLPAFAGFSLLTLVAAYAHTVFATPGLFRAAGVAGAWGPGVAVLLLATDAGPRLDGVQAEPQAPDRPCLRRRVLRAAPLGGRSGAGRGLPPPSRRRGPSCCC